MILNWFEVTVHRLSGQVVAVIPVEAVSKTNAEEIARRVVLDRCRLEPGDTRIETRLVVQGLQSPVGDGWRERDRIKRKVARWRAGLAKLDAEERQAVMAALLRDEVPGRVAMFIRAGDSENGPSPLPLIPIRSRLVTSDEILESHRHG